jgi:predicted phage-related endonuclease
VTDETKTPEQLAHEEFQRERAPRIGGSDVPAILGMSKYRSAFDVWLRITEARAGRPVPQTEDNDRLEMGRLLEPVIAQRAERRLGLPLRTVETLRHPQFEWLSGNIDREVVDGSADVELKSVEWDPLNLWSDPSKGEEQRIPEDYYVQVVTYMGLRLARKETRPHHVAAQFGFQGLRMYRYDPDRLSIATWSKILERLHEFWERHVLTGEPPPVGASKATEAWLKEKFPTHGDDKTLIVDNSDDVAEVFRAYKAAADKFDEAEKNVTALENEIKRLVGARYGIEGENQGTKYRATWAYVKPQTGLVTDWKKVLDDVCELNKVSVPVESIQNNTRPVTFRAGYRTLRPGVKEK